MKKLIWRYLSSRENARSTSMLSLEELIGELPDESLEKGASSASSERLWKDNNAEFGLLEMLLVLLKHNDEV